MGTQYFIMSWSDANVPIQITVYRRLAYVNNSDIFIDQKILHSLNFNVMFMGD